MESKEPQLPTPPMSLMRQTWIYVVIRTKVTVLGTAGSVTFRSQFMIVAAMTPWECVAFQPSERLPAELPANRGEKACGSNDGVRLITREDSV